MSIDEAAVNPPQPPPNTLPSAQGSSRRRSGSRWLTALLRRLHFYAGVFVGPFILVAALTGAVYAFSPQIERAIYAEELSATSTSTDYLPIAEQVRAAQDYLDEPLALAAIRPAPNPGDTTRVMFVDDTLGDSEHRGIFVDPVTAAVRGDQPVYGTSGSLPFRTGMAQLHKNLLQGDWGRLYSELAASWLGIVILAGVGLWINRWRKSRRSSRGRRGMLLPDNSKKGLARGRSWHASIGIWVAVGGLFLASTGITWSTFGGANVSDVRGAMNWTTPAVDTSLAEQESAPEDGGTGVREGVEVDAAAVADPADADDVLRLGRQAGFTSTKLELIAPQEPDQAWSMRDISMTLPAPEVYSVAVDPTSEQVVDVLHWADYPLMAKLAQWGIWMHMGMLFGMANQVLLALTAIGLAGMVVLGYLMWWQRRPRHRPVGLAPARGALRDAPWWAVALVAVVLAGIGWFLPILGASLAVFLAIDVALGFLARTRHRVRLRQPADRAS